MMPSRDFQNQCSLCEMQMPLGIIPMHRTLRWWIFSVVQWAEEFSAIHKNKAHKIRYQDIPAAYKQWRSFGFSGLSRKFCASTNSTGGFSNHRTLLEPYLNNGHVLYADNFYTIPRLAHYLLQNGTAFVGTVTDSGGPASLVLDAISVMIDKREN